MEVDELARLGQEVNQKRPVPLLWYLKGPEVELPSTPNLIFIQSYNKWATCQIKTLCTGCAKSTMAQSILNIHPGTFVGPAKHTANTEADFEGRKSTW